MSPKTPQLAVDPNLAAEQAKASATLTDSLQNQARMDTASLLARYGTHLALASGGMSPLTTPAPLPPAASPTSGIGLA